MHKATPLILAKGACSKLKERDGCDWRRDGCDWMVVTGEETVVTGGEMVVTGKETVVAPSGETVVAGGSSEEETGCRLVELDASSNIYQL